MKTLKCTSLVFLFGLMLLAAFPYQKHLQWVVEGLAVAYFGVIAWYCLYGIHAPFRKWKREVMASPPKAYYTPTSKGLKRALYIVKDPCRKGWYTIRFLEGTHIVDFADVRYEGEDEDMFVFVAENPDRRFYMDYDKVIDVAKRVAYKRKIEWESKKNGR
jgi:hypothetical protein